MTNWPICSMGAQVRFLSGGTPRKDEARFWNGEIPWVSSAEMVQRRIDETVLRVTEDGAKEGSRLIPKNTVLVVVRGMSLAKEFRVAITKKELTFNQDLKALLPSNNLNPVFLFYYLLSQSKAICDSASEAAHGTKKLDMPVLEQWPLPLPPKNTQKKIAAILSAYDDLIENNRRRIALLEKMAEEIYREWFVRMRFPGHEKVRFSKGLPVEWNIRRVKEIVVRKRFGRIYRDDELFDDGKIIVIDQSRSNCLGYYDGESQHMASPRTPIILFGDHTCKMVLMTKPFSLAENVIPFTPNFNVAPYFLFHLVKDLARTTEYKRHWTDLTNKEVLVPKEDLQLEFESIVKRNHEQIEVLQQVIRKAEKVRDMLLPRLISGKLSVENLDIRFPPSMEEMNHEV